MNKKLYLFDLILFIWVILLRVVFINHFNAIYDLFNLIFFLGFYLVVKHQLGIRKDNNICKINAIQITIITILLYILLTYLSGMYFGFLKNSYSLNLLNILGNIYSIGIIIVLEELIRYMFAAKCNKDKKPLMLLTIVFILLDIALTYNSLITSTQLQIFTYICTTVLPIIARNVVCTYLCDKVSYIPGMILRLFFGLSIYILPIFPDYGFYIDGVLGIFIPYIIYLKISKLVEDSEKRKPRSYKTSFWFINVPIIAVLVFLVILVSGIFKYQIIAIGSGSMSPLIEKGDAVIITKLKKTDYESIKPGQILVFVHEGRYITHRVLSSTEIEGKYYFQTKGDANSDEDKYTVQEDDIIGITDNRIKWIGLPTVWFQELVSKEN